MAKNNQAKSLGAMRPSAEHARLSEGVHAALTYAAASVCAVCTLVRHSCVKRFFVAARCSGSTNAMGGGILTDKWEANAFRSIVSLREGERGGEESVQGGEQRGRGQRETD